MAFSASLSDQICFDGNVSLRELWWQVSILDCADYNDHVVSHGALGTVFLRSGPDDDDGPDRCFVGIGAGQKIFDQLERLHNSGSELKSLVLDVHGLRYGLDADGLQWDPATVNLLIERFEAKFEERAYNVAPPSGGAPEAGTVTIAKVSLMGVYVLLALIVLVLVVK